MKIFSRYIIITPTTSLTTFAEVLKRTISYYGVTMLTSLLTDMVDDDYYCSL